MFFGKRKLKNNNLVSVPWLGTHGKPEVDCFRTMERDRED